MLDPKKIPSSLAGLGRERLQQWLDEHNVSLKQGEADELAMGFGLSDFIFQQLLRHPGWATDCLHNKPNAKCYEPQLGELLASTTDENELSPRLRQFRNREMCRIAWFDLSGQQTIEASLSAVSALADALILATYQWHYRQACKRWGTPMGSKGEQNMLILGMGKLGGRELNFSSDIDLIFTYPEQGELDNGRKSIEHQQFFTKIAQKLIASLHQITADGQVFRVDMRLRPFGDSGALVSHFAALEDYYQQQGREWERYAMVKARILNAGDAYAEELQSMLKPFVYRRYIDFGVLESLRDMKQMIQQEVRRRNLGNNIKLGAGGIREIEFIIQSIQLTRGGKQPQLQTRNLLQTLQVMEQEAILPNECATELRQSYLYLRKVEHCLQQFADKQTQELPGDELGQTRLSWLMQDASYRDFMAQLSQVMSLVRQQFSELIGDGENDNAPNDSNLLKLQDLWILQLNQEETGQLLAGVVPGSEQQDFFQSVGNLKSELQNRPMGARGKETIDKLLPLILYLALAVQPEARGTTLQRIGVVLKAICRRTAYLELLLENHGALEQLLSLCQKSPWIAEQLARFPLLLDELINPASLYQPTPLAAYPDLLRQLLLRVPEDDLEQQMEALRQFKLCQQLRVAAEDVCEALPIMKVSDHLTALAETLIADVVNIAWQHMVEKYGYPADASEQDKRFAVIAYGKLGGIELGYSSDLDLVFLHDSPKSGYTTGDKSIESRQFYVKLAQRIIHLFSTKTASGELYEIDMRLRPSGNSGLLVSSVDSFRDYQEQEAWIWEHQALVRSRAVAGSANLLKKFAEIKRDIICQQRDGEALKQEVSKMRTKMRQHLDKSNQELFDLKQGIGGIADIEFLVQYWTLLNANKLPELSCHSDNVNLLETLASAGIISDMRQQQLKTAYLNYRNASHRLALKNKSSLVKQTEFQDLKAQVAAIWQEVFSHS